MTMKKQPEGVTRQRRGDTRPASEYDIFRGSQHLGSTHRQDKGRWKPVSAYLDAAAALADGAPVFKDHTQAVEWLLEQAPPQVVAEARDGSQEAAQPAEDTSDQAEVPAAETPAEVPVADEAPPVQVDDTMGTAPLPFGQPVEEVPGVEVPEDPFAPPAGGGSPFPAEVPVAAPPQAAQGVDHPFADPFAAPASAPSQEPVKVPADPFAGDAFADPFA